MENYVNMPVRSVPRQWLVRSTVALLALALIAPAVISGATYFATSQNPANLRASVDDPANGTTIISIQGFHFQGMANPNKPARLVAVGPRGEVKWIHNGSGFDARWFYDVDPLDNGNLLVTATAERQTLVYELNPRTQERVWTERFDIHDTHDVDLINGDQLLVANMRNYDSKDEVNRDRIFIYDRSKDKIVWQWQFENQTNFTKQMGGDYASKDGTGDDWTHVNDVDKINEGSFLISPRNMDQVMVINRSTKEITMRLGSDQNYSVLYEQHNPQYLRGKNGTPTLLVADSENDRIVEYAQTNKENWTRTWSLGTRGLNWPRDADRLPNGNTLIVDTMNHRVIEVTPQGEIVWEFYAPWAPYDVERLIYDDEAGGPTMRETGTTGSYNLSGSGLEIGADTKTVSFWVAETFEGTPVESQANEFARAWAHVTPWIRPVWMSSWEFLGEILGGLVLSLWGLTEGVYQRQRIWNGLLGVASRIQDPIS